MAPVKVKNKVNQLTWNVPIVNANGTPTDEFMRKWLQQATANASVTDLSTAANVSAVLDLISSVVGAIMVRGATQWTGLVPVADGRVLRDKGVGSIPIWDTISDVLDVIGNTRGSLLYRGAAGWAILAPSAAGKVLTDGGAGADPSWQAGGGSGGGAASIQDDGTTVYLAISDGDGQLVLDGAGDPIFMPEVFPVSAIPALPYAPSTLRTRQIITSGTTYTAPVGPAPRQIFVRMVGGGAGAGGSAQSSANGGNGGVGTDSIFNGYHAKGGAAGSGVGTGSGYSGAGSNGSGADSVFRINGASSVTVVVGVATSNQTGSNGGDTPLGNGAFNLQNAAANTGGGGGGAGVLAAIAAQPGSGGGASEYVELVISNPAASYTIAIGVGGTGGTAGTGGLAGGNGGSGLIIVDEFY